MLVSQRTWGVPYGLLIVSDDGSDMSGLPDDFSREQGFAAAGDAVVFGVEHMQIADVTVRVWRDAMDTERAPDVSVPISVPSGRLVLGDAERGADITTVIDLPPGGYVIDAYFDVPFAPESVDLVFRAA